MSAIDPRILEQLSAWMDGELPADEARFLQRRLRSDVALREQWERWQIASACLQREPVRLMDGGLSARILSGVADAANDSPARRPPLAWLASVAAVALAALLLPRFMAVEPGLPATAEVARPALVSMAAAPPVSPTPDQLAVQGPPMSPLPSVLDFPLVDNGRKAWPRSPLLAAPAGRNGLLVRSDARWAPVAPPEAPAPAEPDAK